MPAASSGASSPLSAASTSTANFRTAVVRTLVLTDPRPRSAAAPVGWHLSPKRGSLSEGTVYAIVPPSDY
jgi:hypothetical protein